MFLQSTLIRPRAVSASSAAARPPARPAATESDQVDVGRAFIKWAIFRKRADRVDERHHCGHNELAKMHGYVGSGFCTASTIFGPFFAKPMSRGARHETRTVEVFV